MGNGPLRMNLRNEDLWFQNTCSLELRTVGKTAWDRCFNGPTWQENRQVATLKTFPDSPGGKKGQEHNDKKE